jgi:hypothetical protein
MIFKSILLNILTNLKEAMNTEMKKTWKTKQGKLEKTDII